MKTESEEARRTVKVSRRLKASAEHVFDAWLDPERARQFLFTRPGQVVVHAELEARVGGAFLFVVRRNGKDMDHVGRYLEIEPPKRLVFLLRVPDVWESDTRVAIDIVPLGASCELTVTHEEVLPELEASIQMGWTAFLEGLDSLLERQGAAA